MTTDKLKEAMMSEAYQGLIEKIKGGNLLALPQSVVKFLELAKDPENGPPEYAKVISADPGLTLQILRFANSAFFGFQHKITTVQGALALISMRTIKNFVLWNTVLAILPDPKCGPFDLRVFVLDSLRRGCFAKALGKCFSELDSEELFVAALLQDITLPMLAQIWPKEYEELLIRHRETGIGFSRLEEEAFGWNHATAGGLLVKEWGLGEELASKIAVHGVVECQNPAERKRFLEEMILYLTSLMPSCYDKEWKEEELFFVTFAKLQISGIADIEVFKLADQLFADLLVVAQLEHSTDSIVSFHRHYLASMLD